MSVCKSKSFKPALGTATASAAGAGGGGGATTTLPWISAIHACDATEEAAACEMIEGEVGAGAAAGTGGGGGGGGAAKTEAAAAVGAA